MFLKNIIFFIRKNNLKKEEFVSDFCKISKKSPLLMCFFKKIFPYFFIRVIVFFTISIYICNAIKIYTQDKFGFIWLGLR
jgi:hypothetical protein